MICVFFENTHLDASKKYGEINLLEEELLNWNGRLITEDGRSKWVNLLPNKQAEQNTMLSVTIDNDLNTNAKVINKLTGHKSYAFKKKYANVAKVSQLEMFENQFKNNQKTIQNRSLNLIVMASLSPIF